jgi:hypothetical protein
MRMHRSYLLMQGRVRTDFYVRRLWKLNRLPLRLRMAAAPKLLRDS